MPYVERSEFSDWVNRYGKELYGYTKLRVNDADTAKDLVQETFVAAWKNIEKYRGQATPKTWLYAILKNKITDYYRQKSAALTISMEDAGIDFFNEKGYWKKEALPADADAETDHAQLITFVQRCKERLQKLQNMVFTMKHVDDMPSEEICKVLNISASNYWVLMHRAKLQLRNCLQNEIRHASL